MPIAFEQFRLIGTGGRIKNESTLTARVKEQPVPEAVTELPPGAEVDINGDVILEVEVNTP